MMHFCTRITDGDWRKTRYQHEPRSNRQIRAIRRPHREVINFARGRVAGCNQQEDAEYRVETHHHRQRGVLLPHQKWINASEKQLSDHHKHDPQRRPFSLDRRILAVTNL